ncbi:MAG: YlcI/YnfO family protein [Streptosporangiaceae bacterium]
MGAGVVVQVRVPPDLLEQIDQAAGDTTRTGWLLDAARSALADTGPGACRPIGESSPASGGLVPAEPSPGVACSAPGCWDRSTTRYGLRRIPLCPACAAALTGAEYRRPRPGLPGQRAKTAAGAS